MTEPADRLSRFELIATAEILRTGEDTYGYPLMERTRSSSGTVYPLLKHAVERGILEEHVDPDIDTPIGKRRFYGISTAALAVVHQELAVVQVPDLDAVVLRCLRRL